MKEVSDNRFRTSWEIKDITVNLENENDKERNITTGSGNSTDEFKIRTTVNAYDKMSHYVKFINEINTGTLNICKNIELLEGEKFEDYTNDIFDFKVSFTSILGTQI